MTQEIPSPAKKADPRLQKLAFGFLIVFIIGLVAVFMFTTFRDAERARVQITLPKMHHVGEFSLVDQNGAKFTHRDLLGKVWVAGFVFVECPGPCPLITSRMAELQSMLKRAKNVRLVTITVDPEHDTPEVLRTYATQFHAEQDRWHFLTGEKSAVEKLVMGSFFLPISNNPVEKQWEFGRVLHSSKVALVDAEGHVRGYFDGTDLQMPQTLLKNVGFLMREGGLE